jgi:hypothetical protein
MSNNKLDEITNYIMDEFVRGKLTTSDTNTDEDDKTYTRVWNDVHQILHTNEQQ